MGSPAVEQRFHAHAFVDAMRVTDFGVAQFEIVGRIATLA